jgi:hypothetical protein
MSQKIKLIIFPLLAFIQMLVIGYFQLIISNASSGIYEVAGGKNFERIFKATQNIYEKYTFETFVATNWIFNGNIMQYGTIMSLREDGLVEIEAIIYSIDLNLIINMEFVKCLVKLNDKTIVLREVVDFVEFRTLNVKCLLSAEDYSKVEDVKRVVVSVVDIREYTPKAYALSLYGKVPNFFNRQLGREKAYMNCACTIWKMSANSVENILAYARINLAIGVKRLQFYATDFKNPYFNELKDKHSNVVEVYGYELDIKVICSAHRSLNLDYCMQRYGELFKHTDQVSQMKHEGFIKNFCFLKIGFSYFPCPCFIFPFTDCVKLNYKYVYE